MIRLLFVFIVGLIATSCAVQPSRRNTRAVGPPDAKRIVFLGDSITYSGEYVSYLELYLLKEFPERDYDIIDVGLPSETVSGLSEPGHAGGAFPRPDIG